MRNLLIILLTLFPSIALGQQSLDAKRIFLGATGATCPLTSGAGSPEGVVTAPQCAFWFQTDSPYDLWRKYSGTGNTGWLKVTAGATGAIGGSGASGRVAYWSAASTLTSDSDLLFDGSLLTTAELWVTSYAPLIKILPSVIRLQSPDFPDEFTFDQFVDGTIGATRLDSYDETTSLYIPLLFRALSFDFAGTAAVVATIANSSTDATVLFIANTDASPQSWGVATAGSSNAAGNGAFYIRDETASTNRLVITPGGGVSVTGTLTATGLRSLLTTEQFRASYDATNYLSVTVGSTGIAALDAISATSADAVTIADTLGHPSYTSQTTNWRVTAAGSADFRYLYADELRVKLFSAEEQAVYRASLMVAPSFSEVSQSFTCPNASLTATLWVRDAATLSDARVFTSGDQVSIRNFTRTDTDVDGAQDLVVGDCVGAVTVYTDGSGGNAGQQSWTFTRGAGGNAGTIPGGTVVAVGSIVLDFGTAGDGAVELSAYDGTEGENAPWIQTKTWSTSPVAANFAVTTRLGNLSGLSDYTTTSCTGSVPCFGMFAGSATATNIVVDTTNGVRFRNSTTTLGQLTSSAWTLGSTSTEHVNITSSSVQVKDGATVYSDLTAGAFSLGNTTNEHVLVTSTAVQLKDGATVLTAIAGGVVTVGDTTTEHVEITTSALTFKRNTVDYGSLTSTAWRIGQQAAAQSNVYITAGAVQLRNNTTVRISLASDGSGYLANSNISWDVSGNLTIAAATIGGCTIAASSIACGAPFSVTSAGVLTATSGAIGGFSLGADYIRDVANSMGIASTVSGSDDVRFWAGDTFANRDTAPFSVTEAGYLRVSAATFGGGSNGVDVDGSGLVVNGTGRIESGNVELNADGLVLNSGADADGNRVKWSNSGNYIWAAGNYMRFSVAGAAGEITFDNNNYFAPTTDAISLGASGAEWGDLYALIGSTDASEYPVVMESSGSFKHKTDGYDGTCAAGGEYVNSLTIERGIVTACTTAAEPSAMIELRREIEELRQMVLALTSGRRAEAWRNK